MDTNREAVSSLIGLLVRKSGFDLNKNQAEEELVKTKDNIAKLIKEKENSNDKKNLTKVIENLKIRQAFWENNAEVVGKSLLEAYDEGKTFNNVRIRIDHLVNLANKGTKDLQMCYIYSRIGKLEEELNKIQDKIHGNKYINTEEKEMDIKYKSYLENKINSIDKELIELDKELNNLKEIETKDIGIVNKLKDYNDSLTKNMQKLEDATDSNINADMTFDVWEKIESAKNDINNKLEKSKDVLSKTENMLEDVRKNFSNLSARKDSLINEKKRCGNKLEIINNKIEEDKYENTTEKMMDISKCDSVRLEIESLKNKKDVIYVDTLKVREELLKQWDQSVKPKKKQIVDETIESEEDNKLEEKSAEQEKEIDSESNSSDKIIDDILNELKKEVFPLDEDDEEQIFDVKGEVEKNDIKDKSKGEKLIQKKEDKVNPIKNEIKEEKNKYELEW